MLLISLPEQQHMEERWCLKGHSAFERVSTLNSRRKKNPIQDYQSAARYGQTKNSRFAQSASEDTTASPLHQKSRYLLLLGPGNVPPVPWSSNRGVYGTAAAIMQSAFIIRSWQLLKYFTYPVYLERCDLNIQCLETFERKTERIRQ